MNSVGVQWWRPRPGWWLLLLGLGLVCTLGAAGLKVKDEPYWPVLATAAFGAFSTLAIDEAKRLRGKADDQDKKRRDTSALLVDGRELPRLETLTPQDLGARPPLAESPYRHRQALEKKIRDVLAAGRPVLVIGESMLGKSRVAAEVVLTDYPTRRVWIPLVTGRGLEQLLAAGVPSGVVVWLDDLDAHLGGGKVRDDWLHLLTEPGRGNVVVATMRRSAYEALIATDDRLNPHVKVVRGQFTHVDFTITTEEDADVASRAADRQMAEGIRRYGLGPFLGGGYLAIERYDNGGATHPWGTAMVRAAADWRRVGLEVIPAAVVKELSGEYVNPSRRYDAGEGLDEALSWAAARVHEVVQLLERPTADGYRVTDYLLDHLSAGRPSTATDVPEATWQAAADHAVGPDQMIAVAVAANTANRSDHARTLSQRVVDFAHPDQAPKAMILLGFLDEQARELQGARTWYQRVVDSAHQDYAPGAMGLLGFLEKAAGDVGQARVWWQRVVDSDHPERAPMAMVLLGVLEDEAGEVDQARTWWQRAVDSGHPEASAVATRLLSS